MSLPVVQTPEYELELPSSGEKIKYRPFLVKEEKMFLLALESGEVKEMVNALRQVIKQCTFDAVDVDKLPNFDLEYIFLQLRCKSVGSVVEISFKGKDGNPIPVQVNLEEVEVVKSEIENVIMLDKKVGIEMTYPVFEKIEKYAHIENEHDLGMEIVNDCIKNVINGEEVIPFDKESEESRKGFIERFSKEHYESIMKYFNSMPKLRLKVEYKDGTDKKEVVLEGLQDFFT